MRDKVLAHASTLLAGTIHNLNTPLMWIMGRTQLMEIRNGGLEKLKNLPIKEIQEIKEKNAKDLSAISEGADRINTILKTLSYKVHMAHKGFTAIDLKEYLQMETDFLLGDMRFKHETNRDFSFNKSASCSVDMDYNALSWAITGIIQSILNSTEKSRHIKIDLEDHAITISCPEINAKSSVKKEIKDVCKKISETATISLNINKGLSIRIDMEKPCRK